MQIFKFNSILKPVLWGGDKIMAFKRLPACEEPIGESWELSAMPGCESVVANGDDHGLTLVELIKRYGAELVGQDVYQRYGDRFPLLIKLIDAKRDLSIQVHPNDEIARSRHACMGKTEMWYILQAEEGALIHSGFNREMSGEELVRRLADSSLLDVINATPSHPGDAFFIPAGQIHTIGSGNLLVEIQQSSDITYRVWDYNRRDAHGNLRQLHVQEAREALNYAASNGLVTDACSMGNGLMRLVRCDEFVVYCLDIDGGCCHDFTSAHSFVALVCVDGETTIMANEMSPVTLSRGETALIPAVADRVEFNGSSRLLLAMVPCKS